ncbi:MAG: dTDP-4-dehydrorhamnose reductase [Pseudomonadota bacterium]
MTILVFGKTGQVGMELAKLGAGITSLGREEADLTDPASCAAQIQNYRPRAVINAAAYTAVDKAEDEPERTHVINADAPAAMAREAAAQAIPFVHISTDYVFDGSGDKPWQETDETGALNTYGRTKAAGEAAIREAGGRYAILRTSWVYSEHGSNFLKTMLRLGGERDALSIVGDQIGGPTPARKIAETCFKIANVLRASPERSGTYHFSGTPNVSWAEFAEAIFSAAKLEVAITRIPTSDFPTPAARPKNSRLDCRSLKTVFGIEQPDWRASLPELLDSLSD